MLAMGAPAGWILMAPVNLTPNQKWTVLPRRVVSIAEPVSGVSGLYGSGVQSWSICPDGE